MKLYINCYLKKYFIINYFFLQFCAAKSLPYLISVNIQSKLNFVETTNNVPSKYVQ